MRKFDPWPVFFKREWNRCWPFLVGFAVTGTIVTKFSLSLTEEDAKNSPFAQAHKKRKFVCLFFVFRSGCKP
ncbi:ATP synthase small subunit 6-A, mitochondrial-like isoform X1 [Salvia miltiorrhiza]|uniref:ATP synthase small subunit 6-A, mitochondrial-like isoform X1 n=1 Tax=Salvia miltiorrhiza TaxID=226208 RepID=UPI0025AD445C|nr:ATP synthase small subunit 6-A, mitochondrial-like isoform X1 [Salvia miltiorrhiza]